MDTAVRKHGHKSKKQKRQERAIDQMLAKKELTITAGRQKYNALFLYTQTFFRIFYVTVYYYLVPFTTVVMGVVSIFF